MSPDRPVYRCAHPEVLALDAARGWPMRDLRYYQAIAYPGVDPAQVAAEYAEAWRRVAGACGISVTASASPAGVQVLAVSGPIDGPYNVLALTELPTGQPDFVSHQTFDDTEAELSSEQRIACMAHEACHALGIGHAPAGTVALMAPVLSDVSRPQAWDIAQLQALYGPPAPEPPPSNADPAVTLAFAIAEPGDYVLTLHPVLTRK